jgi:hypothetical protein
MRKTIRCFETHGRPMNEASFRSLVPVIQVAPIAKPVRYDLLRYFYAFAPWPSWFFAHNGFADSASPTECH